MVGRPATASVAGGEVALMRRYAGLTARTDDVTLIVGKIL